MIATIISFFENTNPQQFKKATKAEYQAWARKVGLRYSTPHSDLKTIRKNLKILYQLLQDDLNKKTSNSYKSQNVVNNRKPNNKTYKKQKCTYTNESNISASSEIKGTLADMLKLIKKLKDGVSINKEKLDNMES